MRLASEVELGLLGRDERSSSADDKTAIGECRALPLHVTLLRCNPCLRGVHAGAILIDFHFHGDQVPHVFRGAVHPVLATCHKVQRERAGRRIRITRFSTRRGRKREPSRNSCVVPRIFEAHYATMGRSCEPELSALGHSTAKRGKVEPEQVGAPHGCLRVDGIALVVRLALISLTLVQGLYVKVAIVSNPWRRLVGAAKCHKAREAARIEDPRL
mmetsp:Transcript_24756/g.69965  ORF Transcript_24756/g.69965 Transcript_24756/m.69965 type:complete len:215 (+) Transcript_24756:1640-2284(+)